MEELKSYIIKFNKYVNIKLKAYKPNWAIENKNK